jgi:hypothetical protein
MMNRVGMLEAFLRVVQRKVKALTQPAIARKAPFNGCIGTVNDDRSAMRWVSYWGTVFGGYLSILMPRMIAGKSNLWKACIVSATNVNDLNALMLQCLSRRIGTIEQTASEVAVRIRCATASVKLALQHRASTHRAATHLPTPSNLNDD